MSEKFEPKPYTEEELKHEKTRALETADLIRKKGAEFINTPEGPVLAISGLTAQNLDTIVERIEADQGFIDGTKEKINFTEEEAMQLISSLSRRGRLKLYVSSIQDPYSRDELWKIKVRFQKKKGLVGEYNERFEDGFSKTYIFRVDEDGELYGGVFHNYPTF